MCSNQMNVSCFSDNVKYLIVRSLWYLQKQNTLILQSKMHIGQLDIYLAMYEYIMKNRNTDIKYQNSLLTENTPSKSQFGGEKGGNPLRIWIIKLEWKFSKMIWNTCEYCNVVTLIQDYLDQTKLEIEMKIFNK